MASSPALVLLVLAPTALAGWSLDLVGPERAPSGLPFLLRACAWAPAGELVEFRVAPLWTRYAHATRADATGHACALLPVEPDDVEGELPLTVKARPAGGDGAKAQGSLVVRLAREGVRVQPCGDPCAARDGLLVPAPEGRALVPASDAPRLGVESAWGAPFHGFVVRNDGPGEARLGGLALGGAPLPDLALAEGARVFLGERAPPGLDGAAPFAKPKPGNATLAAAKRALDALVVPRLAPGEVATRDGVERAGRTHVAPLPLPLDGGLVAFATPDAGAAPLVDAIDAARGEILLETYTLTSAEVGAALARALARGVHVRVLLEGAPVGGVPAEEGALVAALVGRGADVAFLRSAPGFPARYATLHAKLLVVDREVVVISTENPHASSYPAVPGAGSSRGFGLVAREARLAGLFADVFGADAAPWPDVQTADLDALPPPADLAARAGASRGPMLRVDGRASATPILSPDAPLALAEAIARAERSVDVAMLFAEPRFGDAPDPFLDALVAAARRNASVRLLLDGRHDEGRNAAVAERLNALAAREGLALEARVDEPSRTLHAKLVVVDGARAYVGSMNWGRAAAHENREMGLLVDAPRVAAFFAEAFGKDWEKEEATAPRREAGGGAVVISLLSCLLLPLLRGRRRA